ncbi:hypothetical protein [Marinobacter sp. C1S70]|uniref:hypothetical protein n=1 Tax=Marinobacter sp. C1S70 TaxID=1396859 RepID=UPI001D0D38AE|nr:hypothetical protein [Marinobacter sp. C1S70]
MACHADRTAPVFQTKGLTKTYRQGDVEVHALRGVDISLYPGELVVMLCDEPTGALDSATGILVLAALERANRETGTTTVIITHNASIANMADRVITLSDGVISGEHRNSERQDPNTLSW